mgnify:FL=1
MQGHIASFSSPIKWIRQGLQAIRQAPFGMVSICIFYVFTMSILGTLPFIGLVLAALFMPFGTLLIIQGTKDAYDGREPDYGVIVRLFKDRPMRYRLFRIGLVYAAFLLVANYIYLLTAMDEMSQWQVSNGEIVCQSVLDHFPWTAAIITLLCYTAGQMATWFAPALVAWKNMTLGKAIFYSFFGCLRNWLAILVLLILLGVITMLCSFGTIFLASALGISDYAIYIMTPIAFVLTAITYSTIWPMWADIYGDIAVD